MSCNTRHAYELSLCLDGRLPSRRRSQLLDHVDGCEACAETWDEMQRAQELALSLPPQEVRGSFEDGLWERIRAGEGTPEAVFHEPIPLTTKVRYVLTGAAAAAIVIFVSHLWSARDLDVANSREDIVITGELPESNDAPRVEPVPIRATAPMANLATFSPMTVAEAGADSLVRNTLELKDRTTRLARRGEPVPLQEVQRELEPVVAEIRSTGYMMQWLAESEIVQLPQPLADEIQRTMQIATEIERAGQSRRLSDLFESLQRLEIDRLRQRFEVLCCQNPQEFASRFGDHLMVNPGVARALRVEVVPTRLDGTPGGSSMIFIRRLDSGDLQGRQHIELRVETVRGGR